MNVTSENIQLSITFRQVFDIIKDLPKKRKAQLFNYLHADLAAPKKISIDDLYRYEEETNTVSSNGELSHQKPVLDMELLEMLDEIPTEEPEMTDEEFYKSVEEMD